MQHGRMGQGAQILDPRPALFDFRQQIKRMLVGRILDLGQRVHIKPQRIGLAAHLGGHFTKKTVCHDQPPTTSAASSAGTLRLTRAVKLTVNLPSGVISP